MRRRWTVLGAVALWLAAVGCEGDGGAAAEDVAGDTPVAVDGTGPPSACGGIAAGTWVSAGGLATEGDDSLKLRVGTAGRPLDITVRSGSDIVMLGFMNDNVAAPHRPRLDENGRAVVIGPIEPDTTDAAVSGAIFDAVNNGFGGNVVTGRLCFDAAPVTGQPLGGDWVFVLAFGAERDLHRIQGSFSVPGDAVTAGAGTLELLATGATVTID